MPLKTIAHCVALAASALMLSSCGGDQSNGCSAGQNVYTDISYVDTSMLGTVVPESFLYGVGTTPTLTPRTTGIPASCESSKKFFLSKGVLPAGTSLNESTGVVSGTLSQAGSYLFWVSISLDGFSGSVTNGQAIDVADKSAYTYSTWERKKSAPFLGGFRLNSLGDKLVVPAVGYSNVMMDTFVSMDGGTNWSNLAIPGPTPVVLQYATATDGASLYLIGGVLASQHDRYLNQVWKFDGTTWTQKTSNAAFPARANHAAVKINSTLYVIGGESANGLLSDVWKSVDDGVTWTEVLATTPFSARSRTCAVALTGKIALLGGIQAPPASNLSLANLYEVWESADGSNWLQHPIGANDPMRGLSRTTDQQCAVMNGRVYFFSHRIVSSQNLSHWQFEPGNPIETSPGGAASVGGRLYIAFGDGTSQRSVYESAP